MSGTPSPDLRLRLLAQVEEAPAATRAARRRLVYAGLACAGLCLGEVAQLHGLDGLRARPLPYLVALLGGFGLVVLGLALPLWGYRAGPLGPDVTVLARRARWAPLALAASALLGNVLAPSTLLEEAAPAAVNAMCFAIAFGAGLVVLACAVALTYRSVPRGEGALGVGFGTLAGSAAALAISIACPFAAPGHVLLGHVLPVLALGVAAGRLCAPLLRMPPPPPRS